jgi:hypothetical protein
VAGHPVTRLVDRDAFERWVLAASLEERIVAYADKRAGQRLGPMDQRFASWHRRYGGPYADRQGGKRDEAAWRAVRARADRLEAGVCNVAGVAPWEVRRLAWTTDALRAARGEAARQLAS